MIAILEDHTDQHPHRVVAEHDGERFVLHDFFGQSMSAGSVYDGEWRRFDESQFGGFVTGSRVALAIANDLDRALRESRR